MSWERDYRGRIALPGARPRLDPGAIVFLALLALAAIASPPCSPLAAPPLASTRSKPRPRGSVAGRRATR